MANLDKMEKEELVELVKKLQHRKKYGLVWEEKSEDVVEQCKKELPVLEDNIKRAIKKDLTGPTNIIIEGDNYHSLSVLNYTHAGKVDIIYIDPPYNTGAKDWKYNNDYVDENDTYRHSKWLSFMHHRLLATRNLLKSDGVLICTIDENEHSTLGLLLQEVFPEKDIVCITIVHNPGGIQGKNFSYTHEYAYFVYPKGGTYISTLKRDDMKPTPLRDWGKENSKREAAKNCFYPVYVKNGIVVGFGEVCPDNFHPKSNINKKDGTLEVYPVDKKGIERKWRFSRQSVESIKDELICQEIRGEFVVLREKKDYRWKTVWTDGKYNANVFGTQFINKIIDTKFPFPKSIYAVQDCIRAVVHSKEDAIILDFFAGSGTTGHAVMMLNQEDGGNRKFILCTNNENGIAEEVTYQRIKKVISGYNDTKGIPANLRYFKTAFVSKSKVSDDTRRELVRRSTEMICVRENTFDKIVDNKNFKIYKNTDHVTGVLFDLDAISEFKERIAKQKLPASIYVFSLTNDTFDEDFDDFELKHELCPIPESILEVYRKLFKE
jgi:adenine-specific DNA-methyltransferase